MQAGNIVYVCCDWSTIVLVTSEKATCGATTAEENRKGERGETRGGLEPTDRSNGPRPSHVFPYLTEYNVHPPPPNL